MKNPLKYLVFKFFINCTKFIKTFDNNMKSNINIVDTKDIIVRMISNINYLYRPYYVYNTYIVYLYYI